MANSILPSALVNSNDFTALSETSAKAFADRVRFVEEISMKTLSASENEKLSLSEFLDDLELDVCQCLSIPADPNSTPSPWIVHSSWTFDSSAEQRLNFLSDEVIKFMNDQSPEISCPAEGFIEWLVGKGHQLSYLLRLFKESKSYPEAVSMYLAIDIVLATILQSLFKARLNKNIY